jgi:hypothetical protein
MTNPISYASFETDRPDVYRVLKAYDQRAERDADLPPTPGAFTADDIAAVRARDPQAVALISATIQSAGMSMLCQGLPQPRPAPRCPPNTVTDALVSETIAQANAAGDKRGRDVVLSRFATKHSARLSAAQVVRLANAAYWRNSKNWITETFVKANATRLSVADAVALGRAAGNKDGRDRVLLLFAKPNTARLSRADLTTLANAAYWGDTKNTLVKLDVDP